MSENNNKLLVLGGAIIAGSVMLGVGVKSYLFGDKEPVADIDNGSSVIAAPASSNHKTIDENTILTPAMATPDVTKDAVHCEVSAEPKVDTERQEYLKNLAARLEEAKEVKAESAIQIMQNDVLYAMDVEPFVQANEGGRYTTTEATTGMFVDVDEHGNVNIIRAVLGDDGVLIPQDAKLLAGEYEAEWVDYVIPEKDREAEAAIKDAYLKVLELENSSYKSLDQLSDTQMEWLNKAQYFVDEPEATLDSIGMITRNEGGNLTIYRPKIHEDGTVDLAFVASNNPELLAQYEEDRFSVDIQNTTIGIDSVDVVSAYSAASGNILSLETLDAVVTTEALEGKEKQESSKAVVGDFTQKCVDEQGASRSVER